MTRTPRHPYLLDPDKTVLLIVDVQERFRAAIPSFDEMLAGCLRLTRTFQALGLPIVVTEQYPKGLGHTVEELRTILDETPIPEKTTFSALGCHDVRDRLTLEADAVVVCGIEAHVCVQQSVHDLLAAKRLVHVARDAVASRDPANAQAALVRLGMAGAVLTTTEMAAFELLGDAKDPKFKDVQAIFK